MFTQCASQISHYFMLQEQTLETSWQEWVWMKCDHSANAKDSESDFSVAESLSTLRSAATVLLHSCTHINSDSWCVFVNQMPVLQIRHDVQTKCKCKCTQTEHKNDENDIKWH